MTDNGKKIRIFAPLAAWVACGVVALLCSTATATAQNRAEGRDLSALPPIISHRAQGPFTAQANSHEVNMAALPQLRPGWINYQFVEREPGTGVSEEVFEERKAAAAKREPPFTGKDTPFPPLSTVNASSPSVTLESNFNGLAQAPSGGWIPSDMALAAGENFVVQMVNEEITVLDKKGNVQSGFPKSNDAFFGQTSGTSLYDPRGFYDWVNHRYVFTAENGAGILIAASATYDPRGSWIIWGPIDIGSSGQCPDYPTLGHDANNWGGTGASTATKGGVYIGINQFSVCPGGSFIGNYLYMFPKDELYTGGSINYSWYTNLNVSGTIMDTLQPMNITERSDRPSSVYIVSSYNINSGGGQCSSGCNGLSVWGLQTPFTSASLAGPFTVATTNTYSLPAQAPAPNCANCVETLDTRISSQVKYNAGHLYGALDTAAPGPVGGILVFDLMPITNSSGTLTGVKDVSDTLNYYSGAYAFMPAIQPDPEGNIVMVYNYSTTSQSPSTVCNSRRVSLGGNMAWVGSGAYSAVGAGNYTQYRWGDYTATAPDLTIPNRPRMWFSGMYTDGTTNCSGSSGGGGASACWATIIGDAYFNTPSDQ
jgi:hypothetical protein